MLAELFGNINSGAEFTPCRKGRLALWRIWDESKPLVMFIGLNPSKADETKTDATITRVIDFAKRWGYGGVYMMNCFPYVSTDPEVLRDHDKSIFNQQLFFENHKKLIEVSKMCDRIIFAWGNFKVVRDTGRDKQLIHMFPDAYCLKKNKNGSPIHPLYVKGDTEPIKFK